MHLALTNPHLGLAQDEVRALAAAILIHDAATPPLAHLLEYYLKDRSGWNHETALPDMLTGHHMFENVAHQILPGEELRYRRLCDQADVSFELVLEIVQKRHRASQLLFGSLDFDNLDNVPRMGWALGLDIDATAFKELARELAVSIDHNLMLSEQLLPQVELWARVRREIYNLLVFDELTVSSQAVLTKAIRAFFDGKRAADINWASRDYDLLEILKRAPESKEIMLRHFNEALPHQLFCVRLRGSLADLGFHSRDLGNRCRRAGCAGIDQHRQTIWIRLRRQGRILKGPRVR